MDSFINLNNNGIDQLDVGEWEKAASSFRSALTVARECVVVLGAAADEQVTTDAASRQTAKIRRYPEKHRTPRQRDRQSSKTEIRAEEDYPVNATKGSSKRKIGSECEESRKRQRVPQQSAPTFSRTGVNLREIHRTSSRVKNVSNNNEEQHAARTLDLLGRPIWLEPPIDHQGSGKTMSVFISSILYNLGYAFHQMGINEDQRDKQKANSHLKMALKLYTAALRHSIQCHHSPIVIYVTCHNLQQIILHFQKQESKRDNAFLRRYEALQDRKTSILRQFCQGRRNPDQAYRAVLAMLKPQRDTSPAAAA